MYLRFSVTGYVAGEDGLMPLVKLNIRRGRPAELRRKILSAVQSALVETMNVPDADKFQLVNQYDEEDFVHTAAYLDMNYSRDLVMIEIIFIEGRSDEIKKSLIAAISKKIVAATGMNSDDVFLMIQEVNRTNVSFGRGVAQRAA